MINKRTFIIAVSAMIFIFLVCIYLMAIYFSTERISEINSECSVSSSRNDQCNCIQNSINYLSRGWRNYIPQFIFPNKDILDNEKSLYQAYCIDNNSINLNN